MFSKEHPFRASIKERYLLTGKGSSRETWHIVLDLTGSDLSYKVGDSLGIYSENEPWLIKKTLETLNFTGNESIVDKRSLHEMTIKEFISHRGSITNFSRKFLNEVLAKAGLKPEEHPENPKEVIERHHLWDFLHSHTNVHFQPQELADLLMPLLPRFYSISSSPLFKANEVHLTVAHLKYRTNEEERVGVCTHFLCQLAPLHQAVVPVFIQETHAFLLPEDPKIPLIMIGPGTGVAPFRAFMQHRALSNASGMNWLFFGERARTEDFYYEKEWRALEADGLLRLDIAFSRDQEEKVYVQHVMLENGADIAEWLENGAYVYVCGDAQRMAKDVDHALHHIIENHTAHNAIEYIKALKKEKRYLRDVY